MSDHDFIKFLFVFCFALLLLFAGGCASVQKSQCEHEWVYGPYYINAAYSFEEPTFYPPQIMVRVEFCKKCGIVRVDPRYAGCKNMQTCGVKEKP